MTTNCSVAVTQIFPRKVFWTGYVSLQRAQQGQGAGILAALALPPQNPLVQVNSHQLPSAFDEAVWHRKSAPLLAKLGLTGPCQPEQLWQHLQTLGSTCEEQQQELQRHLDLSSCRLLLLAAAATFNGSRQQQKLLQQRRNQLVPLIHAATSLFPDFTLHDFQLLLQVSSASAGELQVSSALVRPTGKGCSWWQLVVAVRCWPTQLDRGQSEQPGLMVGSWWAHGGRVLTCTISRCSSSSSSSTTGAGNEDFWLSQAADAKSGDFRMCHTSL
jgi:hypothetical protein